MRILPEPGRLVCGLRHFDKRKGGFCGNCYFQDRTSLKTIHCSLLEVDGHNVLYIPNPMGMGGTRVLNMPTKETIVDGYSLHDAAKKDDKDHDDQTEEPHGTLKVIKERSQKRKCQQEEVTPAE